MSTTPPQAYIIAARRTALGRVGGLHRNRRLENLTAPVIEAALGDARIAAARVEEVYLGNSTAGGNPARVVALAAGLPETAAALTVDRQCGSGLDAILLAVRAVAEGGVEIAVAGGAESLSTAPWRIAKPKSLYQMPHFIGLEPAGTDATDEPQSFEASEWLARRLGLSRTAQDAYAAKSHLRATRAREARRFVGEIVPLRANADEARDESVVAADPGALAEATPFLPPDGTLTTANTSALHDGAAFVVVVSEAVWRELGEPPALRLVCAAAHGVAPAEEAAAPIAAVTKLFGRLHGFDRAAIRAIEMSESSAAQAIALADALGLDDNVLNADGGAVARGHPLGASGAVLVVRLFSRMVRTKDKEPPRHGVAVQGTIGGLGLAALLERA